MYMFLLYKHDVKKHIEAQVWWFGAVESTISDEEEEELEETEENTTTSAALEMLVNVLLTSFIPLVGHSMDDELEENCYFGRNLPASPFMMFFKIVVLKNFANFTGSSHRSCSVWKGVLRNFAKFTGPRLATLSGTGVFLWILRNF